MHLQKQTKFNFKLGKKIWFGLVTLPDIKTYYRKKFVISKYTNREINEKDTCMHMHKTKRFSSGVLTSFWMDDAESIDFTLKKKNINFYSTACIKTSADMKINIKSKTMKFLEITHVSLRII